MVEINSTPSQAPNSAAAVDDDPLARLHKMSTTAGLGSGDYVAVNGAAVIALLLGLASALALFADLLLVIPIAGVIVGVMAFQQIRRSNGTQTGLGLVALGMLLTLLFGGFVMAMNVLEGVRTRDDRRAIAEVVTQLGQHISSGKYDAAYTLFSPRFHTAFPAKPFEVRLLQQINQSPIWGKIKGMTSGLMQFSTDESTGARYAIVRVQIEFEKTERPLPDDLMFHKEGEQWRIESFQSLFSTAKERGQGQ